MSVLPGHSFRGQVSAVLESPALYREATDFPAYEVKFLLSEAEAREVERRLQPRLTLDPHADPALGNSYRVTSVYFDTADFDVFKRTDGYRRRKFRIRRYGVAPTLFLEQKTKSAQRVRKRRTAIADDQIAHVVRVLTPHPTLPPQRGEGEQSSNHWPGAWFATRLAVRRLRPVCRVSYDRLALVGTTHDGPIRVTFDRSARGERAEQLSPNVVTEGKPFLDDEVITEFKFLGAMPVVFKSVVEGLRLTPISVSKYRRCMEALGPSIAGSTADV